MARRPIELDDLYRLKEASQPSIGADGTVAFVVTQADRDSDANRSSIWSVRPGEEPKRLTNGDADHSPQWSPDGTHLGFVRAAEGSPAQIWLLPSAGGEARKLTDLPLGASAFTWSPDSSRLAVLARVDLEGDPETDEEKDQRNAAPIVIRSAVYKADGIGLIGSKRVHLFVVDVDTGQADALTKGDLNAATPAWSPDGTRIAFAASLEDRDVTGRTHLFVADATGGEPEEIARSTDWKGTAVAPFFAPDGRTIGFAGSATLGPNHTKLFTVPSDGGEPAELVAGFDRNVMIGGPAYPGALPRFISDDTILFCARDRGCTHVYSLRDGTATKIVGESDAVVSAVSDHDDKIAFVRSSPSVPADVYTASSDGTNVVRLTDLNADLLGEIDLHVCEERTFSAPDGTEVNGWVMRGDGAGPQPLLVDVHGGPHNAWSPAFDAVHLYHEILAAQGWSILRLNPRGSDGYGEDFYTGVVGGWGLHDEQDFLSAIDALVAEGIADPDRLAICGYSYGGYMTNWLTARTGLFKAAVSGGCVTDLQSIYGTSDLGYWMGRYEHGGELHEARDSFIASSPLTSVENVETPTLILHGGSDDRCPVSQAEQWFISLRRLGVDVEFVRYPGASHLFILNGRPSHRVDYNRRIADWLTQHLGN